MFELSDARVEVGEPPLTLLEHAELWLERGEHVSLVGPNGAGKTTLIETLAGRRPLAAGKLSTGHNVQVGYLSQHADELGVAAARPERARRRSARDRADAQTRRGRCSGASCSPARRPKSRWTGLSGGERRRLSLAVLVSPAAPTY